MSGQFDNDNKRDPAKFYSDWAYTVPVEGEKAGEYKKTARPFGKKTAILTLIIVLATAAVAASVYLMLNYSFVLDPNNGISMKSRKKAEMPAEAAEGILASEEYLQASNDTGNYNESAVNDFGFDFAPITVKKEPSSFDGEMNAGLLYNKCVNSVVSVSCSSSESFEPAVCSGIIISSDGYILTSAGSIDNAESISVSLFNGKEYSAERIAADSVSSIAIIKIDAENLSPAEFGDIKYASVGCEVISIGNPVSRCFSLVSGIVSALPQSIRREGYMINAFQTDAQCGYGSDGSPVINEFGQVVGVIFKDISDEYGLENLTFAIPSGEVKKIVDELISTGIVSGRAGLGVSLVDIPSSAAAYYHIPLGVMIENVIDGSDAFNKGLTRGDIIVSINNESITSIAELNSIKSNYSVGDTLCLGIYRNNELYEYDILLVDISELTD